MSEAAPTKPYLVFARRWRPQSFDDVVGQDHISQQLSNAVTSGRVGHAFLFRGPRGVGKTSMARILAKALNCESGPTPKPCGRCEHCRNITSGNAMDVIEIDAATHTQVDEMRNILSTVSYAPASMRFKVYIVDEVHMLSKHSFNALLKTLEEPPSHTKFIFATTDPQRVPETIRSRCQDFEFRRISTEDIVKRLDHILSREEQVEVAEDERRGILEALARHAEGGMRDAQVALDQLISLTSGKPTLEATHQLLGAIENRLLLDTVTAIQEGDTARILSIIEGLVESGSDLESFIKSLMQFTRDLMILKTAPGHERLTDLPSTWMDELHAIVPSLSLSMLLNLGDSLFTLAEQMKSASHLRFLLELFFIKLTTVGSVQNIDAVIRQLEEGVPLPRGPAPSAAVPLSAPPTADPLAKPPAPVTKVLRKVVNVSDVSELWGTLTEVLWPQDPRMRTYLEHGRPLSAEGNTLKIGIPQRFQFFHRRLLRDGSSRDLIAGLLGQITGQEWDVRFVLTDDDSTEPPADSRPESSSDGPSGALEERLDEESQNSEEEFMEDEGRPGRALRATDLLDRHPFLRHLQRQFQCTGMKMAPPEAPGQPR